MSSFVAYNGEFDPTKPWLCSGCQKAFRQKGHLQDHIESNHIEGISYNCPFCETEVSSRASLRTHVSQKHQLQQKEYKVKIHQIQPNIRPAAWVLFLEWLWNLFKAQINDIPGEKLCAALNWTHFRTGVPDRASHCCWRTERPLEALAVYRMLQGFQKERPPERSYRGFSYHWFELFLSILLLGYYFTPQATNPHLDKTQHGAQTQPYKDQPNSAKRINGSEFSISTSTCLLFSHWPDGSVFSHEDHRWKWSFCLPVHWMWKGVESQHKPERPHWSHAYSRTESGMRPLL